MVFIIIHKKVISSHVNSFKFYFFFTAPSNRNTFYLLYWCIVCSRTRGLKLLINTVLWTVWPILSDVWILSALTGVETQPHSHIRMCRSVYSICVSYMEAEQLIAQWFNRELTQKCQKCLRLDMMWVTERGSRLKVLDEWYYCSAHVSPFPLFPHIYVLLELSFSKSSLKYKPEILVCC